MKRAALATAAVIALASCSAKKPPSAPHVSSECPDLTKADELGAFDFGKAYALSREAADQLKAAALAALEIGPLADRLDADLGLACTQLAHDLGNKGDWRTGEEACAETIKSVQDARTKLGPKAQRRVLVHQPACFSDVGLLTKCASICDSAVAAEKARTTCPSEAGRCDGDCGGACEREGKPPTTCNGSCSGTCEGMMKGACGGRCSGTCDGKPNSGPCLGVCAGKCDRLIDGECKGQCGGTCTPSKPTICDGVCMGGCSVELAEARCAARPKSPEISADCRASCELAAFNRTECATPQVGFAIVGAKDRETAEVMKNSVERAFPTLLKVIAEVGDDAPARAGAAEALIEKVRRGFGALARSGAAPKASEAQLTKCFDEPFKKAAAQAKTSKSVLDLAAAIREAVSKP